MFFCKCIVGCSLYASCPKAFLISRHTCTLPLFVWNKCQAAMITFIHSLIAVIVNYCEILNSACETPIYYQSIPVVSYLDCKYLCDQDETCIAIVSIPYYSNCWRLISCPALVYASGYNMSIKSTGTDALVSLLYQIRITNIMSVTSYKWIVYDNVCKIHRQALL